MPRRNRRTPPPPSRDIRVMSPRRQEALRAFAVEHIDEHTYMVDFAKRSGFADDVVMTGSECPATGVRFLSTGPNYDSTALRLAGRSAPSDAAVSLGT